MLSRTTETAVMALLFLVLRDVRRPMPPGRIAERLGVSASYLAKIFTRLAKAGILQAHRGVRGGVTLRRPAGSISLLDVIAACEGPLADDHPAAAADANCSYHQALSGFEQSMTDWLAGWSLERLAAGPCPATSTPLLRCRLSEICPKHPTASKRTGPEPRR